MTGSATSPPDAGSRTPDDLGERRAWGWVRHLREGGTTPWQDWSGLDESRGRYLPGAQQLELLRRLNVAGRPDSALAEEVLAASAAGRGRPDLELTGAGPVSAFGPEPVDPGDLPPAELTRVAASVLADRLVAAGSAPVAEPGRPSWWRRGYRLVGDPELADPLRAELVARGRPPGGRDPQVVVVGTDLASMLGHAWVNRAFTDGGPGWRPWLALLRDRRETPARVDLLATARAWEKRVGRDRILVTLDPGHVASAVGVRRLARPAVPSGEAGELARQVGSVLGLLVLPPVRAALLSTRLRSWVAAAAHQVGGGRPLDVPESQREWVEAAAERMRRGLARAGYPVQGSLDALAPRWEDSGAGPGGPVPGVTLELAVRALLDSPGGADDERRTA